MTIGVVLVAYNASDIIIECLESLLASTGADVRIIVVDNCSQDATSRVIRDWTMTKSTLIEDPAKVTHLGQSEIGLIRSSSNLGFAGGVNLGLEALIANPEVDYFWVLNPDCMTEPGTAARLEARARSAGRFGVIGGRVLYTQTENTIQSDGGRINMWTGICNPCHLGAAADSTPAPAAVSLDYISGAHMFVSRAFIARAGLMPEDYFLYYEEMDWCHQRGDLPLLFEVEAVVRHHGGHTIGSATMERGPLPLSTYFLNRARMKFMRKYRPIALPLVAAYSTARAIRSLVRGHSAAGWAALRGIWGLSPPQDIMARIGLDHLPVPRSRPPQQRPHS